MFFLGAGVNRKNAHQDFFFLLRVCVFRFIFRLSMKKGKNIHYYPGRKRQPYVFEKMIAGKRISRAFSTLEAAKTYAERFEEARVQGGNAAVCFEAKDRALLEEIRRVCGDFDPLEAVRWWKEHYRAPSASAPSVAAAWEQFLEWQEVSGRSREHLRSLKLARTKFCRAFADARLEKIGGRELLDWLLSCRGLSPRSVRNLWSNSRNFLSWCKSARGWLNEVPEVEDRLLPIQTRSRVEIWSLQEATAAIRFIEKNFPALVPHFALRLFAGLRRSEARVARWEWIDFEKRTILVPARDADGNRVCKTGDDWLILPTFLPDGGETVFSFLRAYRGPGERIPAPYTKATVKIAKACAWKQNVMRHTFATMLASWNHDDGKTILATRHTNTQTLLRHYKGVNQTIEEARAFFALRPRGNESQLEFEL